MTRSNKGQPQLLEEQRAEEEEGEQDHSTPVPLVKDAGPGQCCGVCAAAPPPPPLPPLPFSPQQQFPFYLSFPIFCCCNSAVISNVFFYYVTGLRISEFKAGVWACVCVCVFSYSPSPHSEVTAWC